MYIIELGVCTNIIDLILIRLGQRLPMITEGNAAGVRRRVDRMTMGLPRIQPAPLQLY